MLDFSYFLFIADCTVSQTSAFYWTQFGPKTHLQNMIFGSYFQHKDGRVTVENNPSMTPQTPQQPTLFCFNHSWKYQTHTHTQTLGSTARTELNYGLKYTEKESAQLLRRFTASGLLQTDHRIKMHIFSLSDLNNKHHDQRLHEADGGDQSKMDKRWSGCVA